MVAVNDKVFVAPLYGQSDNMGVITGPAGAGAVLNEGNYNTWTFQWANEIEYLDSPGDMGIHIDDKNGLIIMHYWIHPAAWYTKFKICNVADFSVVFDSGDVSKYTEDAPYVANDSPMDLGYVYYGGGGTSRSIQTYVVLKRADTVTWEIWRAGAKLWSHDCTTDISFANTTTGYAGISLTSKYFFVMIRDTDTLKDYLMLYKGSSV